jgi:hypothetical protein
MRLDRLARGLVDLLPELSRFRSRLRQDDLLAMGERHVPSRLAAHLVANILGGETVRTL